MALIRPRCTGLQPCLTMCVGCIRHPATTAARVSFVGTCKLTWHRLCSNPKKDTRTVWLVSWGRLSVACNLLAHPHSCNQSLPFHRSQPGCLQDNYPPPAPFNLWMAVSLSNNGTELSWDPPAKVRPTAANDSTAWTHSLTKLGSYCGHLTLSVHKAVADSLAFVFS